MYLSTSLSRHYARRTACHDTKDLKAPFVSRRGGVGDTDYVEARKNSARVERCPRGSAPAAACRQQGDRGENRPERMDALWDAWVQSFPDVVPRLGMHWGNITDLDSHRRMS